MVSLRSCLAALIVVLSAAASNASTNLADWIAAQTKVQTWSAPFVQSRTLKALVQPLTTEGHLWYAAPNRFRWELGKPAQTIAIRNTNVLTILYPNLKRAERYDLGAGGGGAWKDSLALLDAGFPQSRADLDARFNISSVTTTGSTYQVTMQPKSPQARRMIREIVVDLSPATHLLSGTTLRFADGSTLANRFGESTVNAPIDPERFTPSIDASYTVVEPLKQGRK